MAQPKKKSILSTEINGETIRAALDHLKNKKKAKKTEDEGAVAEQKPQLPIDFTPKTPEVNLLPGRVHEFYAAQDTKKKFLYSGIGIAVAFGALFGVTLYSEAVYESEIAKINDATLSHRTELQGLQPYIDYKNAVDNKRTELNNVVSDYLNIGQINENFHKAANSSGYQVTSISINGNSGEGEAEAANCVNPNPFTPSTGVGCVTFTLVGSGNLSQFYTLLNAPKSGFLNVFVPTVTTAEDGKNTVDGSVSVDASYTFDRYRYLDSPFEPSTEESEETTDESESEAGAETTAPPPARSRMNNPTEGG